MSNRFGLRKPETPPYLWPVARLSIYQVSPYSLFNDTVWKFDTLVAGQTTCSVNWRLGVPDEIWGLTRFQRLLRDAKRFLTAYFVEDRPRPRTFTAHAASLRKLVIWMFQKDYRSFSQLDERAREAYFQHMCAQYYDEGRKITVVEETIDGHMMVVTLLFKHRERFLMLPRLQIAFSDLRGIEWGGSGRKIGAKKFEKIQPVPEEVFNPMMAEALRWVDVYSADIIQLLRIQEEAALRSFSWKSKHYASYINPRLVGFKFSKSPLTDAPWRQDIQMVEDIEEADEQGNRKKGIGPLNVLRRLVNHLLAACAIVIQGFSGIRVSELLGLIAEAGEPGEWPSCIKIRPSVDGLNDVFVLSGPIFKGTTGEDAREGDWVVGLRPIDSNFVPEVVRALKITLGVLEGWRELTPDNSVFLYPNVNLGIPRQRGSVGSMLSDALRRLQQQFLAERVDVPLEFCDWPLTSHQFRKKFAQDIIRCDPDAMPAIREHFKHMSMHILETGYIGNDAELLEMIDEFALRDATAQIMAILDGEEVAGKMADEIRKQSSKLSRAIGECPSAEERSRKLAELVGSEGVRAWPCDFGTCLFRAETALCHLAGRGYYELAAVKPLASERCADRCCGCSNLLISARNVEFWKSRYLTNESLRRVYKRESKNSWALLASRRAKVAATILKSHGILAEGLLDVA